MVGGRWTHCNQVKLSWITRGEPTAQGGRGAKRSDASLPFELFEVAFEAFVTYCSSEVLPKSMDLARRLHCDCEILILLKTEDG